MSHIVKLSTESLLEMQKEIENELKLRQYSKRIPLAEKAKATKHEYLVALAMAMLYDTARHEQCLAEHTPRNYNVSEAAYALAKLHQKYYQAVYALSNEYVLKQQKAIITKSEIQIWREISQEFSEVDFIFMGTHYDEYGNGHFFRRS